MTRRAQLNAIHHRQDAARKERPILSLPEQVAYHARCAQFYRDEIAMEDWQLAPEPELTRERYRSVLAIHEQELLTLRTGGHP